MAAASAALRGVWWCVLASFLLLAATAAEDPPKAEARGDTYLDAYADSYSRGDFVDGNGGPGYFGEPSPAYGAPSGGYGAPPGGLYGPPQPQPQPRPVYGPPPGGPYPAPVRPPLHDHHHHHHDHHDLPPAPYAAPDHFFPPIPFDIGLVFKILLKVVIFKLIVKFIAVICLLLFLPALEMYKKGVGMGGSGGGNGGDGDDDRSFSDKAEGRALNDLTERVTSALDAFSSRAGGDCSDAFTCRLQKAFQEIDRRASIPRLLVEYLPPLMPDTNTTSIYRNQQTANRHRKTK